MHAPHLDRVLRIRRQRLGAAERALARRVQAAAHAAEAADRAERVRAERAAASAAAASTLARLPAEADIRLPWASATRVDALLAAEEAAVAAARRAEADQARKEAARALAAARQRVDLLGQAVQRDRRQQMARREQAAEEDRPTRSTGRP